MRKNKRAGICVGVMLGTVAAGVLVGSVFAAQMSAPASEQLQGYLNDFFAGGMRSGGDIFLSSLLDNAKLFIILFAAGFFKLGVCATLGAACAEGYVSGFTAAALVKLMGLKGFLINLSGIFGGLIFMLNVIFFGALSVHFSVSEERGNKNAKKKYILLSLGAATIFCIASLFDGYITTIFMGVIVT